MNAFEDMGEVDPRDVEMAPIPGDEEPEEITEEQVAASIEPEAPRGSTSYDALDLEVEKRFETAMYYRTLLKGSLFNETTEASRIVEDEARAFFKERLEVLLGIRTPKPLAAEPIFSKDEVAALKAVAKRLIAKPELTTAKPSAPSLRQAPVPATAKPPVLTARSAVKAPRTTVAQPAVTKTVPKLNPDNGVIEDTGKIVQQGHKKYRIVKNDLGTEFRQDITGQGRPTAAVPMPMGDAMSAITEAQAANQVSKLDIQVGKHHVGVAQLMEKVNEGE